MKILYDHQAFSIQAFGGISRYFSELIGNISLELGQEFYLSLLLSDNENLPSTSSKQRILSTKEYKLPGKRTTIEIINKLYSIKVLKASLFDLFHPTYYDPYFLKYLEDKPFVLTVHDTIHELFHHRFRELKRDAKYTLDKSQLLAKASQIIAVSETTKRDVIKIYGVEPGKIAVIPLASSLNSVRSGRILQLTGFNYRTKFLLFVGNRTSYKNFSFFLNAVAPLLVTHPSVHLLCAGGPIFDQVELAQISALTLTQVVKHHPVDDPTLQFLYSKAIAFVLPSLYEGFGIPVLEAMENDCPCVLSGAGSLPEVAEDCAIYFEPDNNESIKEAVNRILIDPDLRTRLIKNGRKRAKCFSWSQTAHLTSNLYATV